MKRSRPARIFLSIVVAAALANAIGCGKSSDSGNSSGSDADAAKTFAISGSLASANLALARTNGSGLAASSSSTITHVMAVNPESANPDRSISTVDSNGAFKVKVKPNRPYVLVLIDNSKTGKDMVVAVFKANTLDTIAPLKSSGEADLGTMTVDKTNQKAEAGISYDTLLERLGLGSAAATYLGSIDDLSLRYANPDIDGDGTIDMLQDRTYMLDFHIRADVKKGSSGSNMKVADITDKFFDDSGSDVATPVFNLASIYSIYPASLDNTVYVASSGVSTTLANGGAYSATHADGSTPSANSSFSTVSFNSNSGFGADYTLNTGLELPGSGGSPATLAYTLGAIGKTLTFTNVVTRTNASLTSAGTIMPFIKFDTSGGKIVSLSYKWMKRASATTWEAATSDEVKLVVNDDGGYAGFYRQAKANSIGFRLPREASGTIAWTKANVNVSDSVTEADVLNTTPDDICSMAISYDDKLGLRLFAGGAEANTGVTQCN